MRRSSPPPDWLAELYASLPYAGHRRPRLRLARRCRTAFSCGVWRPTIVAPRHLCRGRRRAALRHVLLHELAHASHGDAVGRTLLNAAFPVLFFHPLYWWLRGQAALAAELVAARSHLFAIAKRSE